MNRSLPGAILLVILLSGVALADDPIRATRETQGISPVTGVVVYGTFTDSCSIVWQSSNMDVRDNPPLNRFERQSTMSYSETTLADNGYTEWNKVINLDTQNKVANQQNFKETTQFDFVSFDDSFGRATFSESLLLDSASAGSRAGRKFLCPFATGDAGFIPAYCNVVEMGSSFTGSEVSMVTQASERHISRSADVPTAVDYSIGLSGVGTVSAWVNAHIMEGRTGGVFNNRPWNYDMDEAGFMQGVDLVYKEKTSASGIIQSFSKSMSYQSGARRI